MGNDIIQVILICTGVCVFAYIVLIAHLYYLENMLDEEAE
ncbi:MAG: hypothetical protein QG559_1560 [Campylobacterota bacterium]|nr:hypothetical protein [Campylobacterota bacterium]